MILPETEKKPESRTSELEELPPPSYEETLFISGSSTEPSPSLPPPLPARRDTQTSRTYSASEAPNTPNSSQSSSSGRRSDSWVPSNNQEGEGIQQQRSDVLRRDIHNGTQPASQDSTETSNIINSGQLSPRLSLPSSSSVRTRRSSSWLATNSSTTKTSKETTAEVKATVFGLLRDLVRPTTQSTAKAAPDKMIAAVREACSSYSLSFSDVIQEKSVEGHTPMYWAILNQNDMAIIATLMDHCIPLQPNSLSDIRHASLLRNDNILYQKIRSHRAVVEDALNGKDDMILGDNATPDVVIVHQAGTKEMFSVDIEISLFQRRMRVSGRVEIEFIARSRLWNISFITSSRRASEPRPGDKWSVTLTLLEDSLPAFIDGRLIIQDNNVPTPSSPIKVLGVALPGSLDTSRAPLSIPLRMPNELVSKDLRKRDVHGGQKKEYSVSIDDCCGKKETEIMKAALRSSGDSSYISPSETLKARLEMRMKKPEEEGCIVC